MDSVKCGIGLAVAGCAGALFAGQISDDFVAAARTAYAKDDACRVSVVGKYAKTDDKNPGKVVKWIDVDGARNVRDIGGWTGLRAGRVFRGTELNKVTTKDGNSHGYELTEAGLKTMREQMGVNSDFDLRAVSPASRGKWVKTSAIGKDIRLLDHPIGSYMDVFTYKGEKAFGAALKEFARPEIYPVYIHCAGGADRTGTLCFLLETLCGVPLADARAEYELTSFSPVGQRTSNRESVQPFATMVRTLSTYPGKTFQEKVAYFAEKVLRLTPAEIAAIRANLCETKAAKDAAADTFRDDPAKYWDVAALKKVPSYRPNPFPDSAIPGMKTFLVKGKGPNDGEAEFFCAYAVPTNSPKPEKGYPCLLLVHGGGGTAYPDYINHYRKNGFAVLAVDWYNQRPLITGEGKGEHGYPREALPGGRRNDQRANIANLVLANSLLRSMPEVDPARNVYVGLSWGSWYGAAIAGIDDRYAGVVEIYCGDANKKKSCDWLVNGRFLHRATMPVWWATWTQDSNVTPRSSQDGWDECPTYWGHVTCPTLGHSHYGFLLDSVMRMARHFAGMGPALPRLGKAELKNGVLSAPVQGLGKKTGKAFLVYTADRENELKPAKRVWQSVPATLEGETVSAKLPSGALIAYLTLNEEGDKPSQLGGSSGFWFAEKHNEEL